MSIKITNVCIRQKNAVHLQQMPRILLNSFSFTLQAGELLVVRGESGCGKSTLLALLAGILQYNVFKVDGEIELFGTNASLLTIPERGVGMLTQDHLLFPHLTVEENLAFVIPSNVSAKNKKQKINEAFVSAGLLGAIKQYPATLSGGERARVAMLMVLMRSPRYVLLDEPFSKLDDKRRKQFRTFVFNALAKLNLPVVMATHDLSDIKALKNSKNKWTIFQASWQKNGKLLVQN